MSDNKSLLIKHSCFDRYLLEILIAIELLMSFTFLGYIHISPISTTIAYLPVVVAGCLWGPAQSGLVALVFGTASMYKASASYVKTADAVFSPFLSGTPVSSILLSIGARVLFGILIGLIFQCVRRSKHVRLYIGLIAAIAPKFHSLIVYTTMGLLFPHVGKNYLSALHWKVNDILFAAICIAVVELFWIVYHGKFMQHVKMCIDQSVNNPYNSKKMYLFFSVIALFLLCMSAFAALYFVQREFFMLQQHGITVSEGISSSLLNLQMQFLTASLSLNAIMIILQIATYKYMSYKEYCIETDALTGAMGRRMFLYYCEKIQKAAKSVQQMGWFLFVDADYFKSINDTLGHAAGDTVLREIAQNLMRIFGEDGQVGRLGGDEFAVIIEKSISQQELESRLDNFLKAISGILPDRTVSCSIGACQFIFPQGITTMLEKTDATLYIAKERGRACYAISPLQQDEDK